MLRIRERARALHKPQEHGLGGILRLGGAAQEGVAQPKHRPHMATVHRPRYRLLQPRNLLPSSPNTNGKAELSDVSRKKLQPHAVLATRSYPPRKTWRPPSRGRPAPRKDLRCASTLPFPGGHLLLPLVPVVLAGVLAADVPFYLAQIGVLELGYETRREDAAGNGHQRHGEEHDHRAHDAPRRRDGHKVAVAGAGDGGHRPVHPRQQAVELVPAGPDALSRTSPRWTPPRASLSPETPPLSHGSASIARALWCAAPACSGKS